ncbi:hypothetical protein MRB53_042116 [Persea americana]|nr:hypothetical protein MRB53_042116 [Persea americana]
MPARSVPRVLHNSSRKATKRTTSDGISDDLAYLPTPTRTPQDSDSDQELGMRIPAGTANGSGTDADDEARRLLRATNGAGAADRSGARGKDVKTVRTSRFRGQLSDKEAAMKKHYWQSESVRKISEVIGMVFMSAIVISGSGHTSLWQQARALLRGLISHHTTRLASFFSESHFDPAALLYPSLLPPLIALSLSSTSPHVFVPNLVLGLAALDPSSPSYPEHCEERAFSWLLTLLPLLPFTTNISQSSTTMMNHEFMITTSPETLCMLYPLHRALLRPLHSITATSLLPAELSLLATGLINVGLFSTSPQAFILRTLLLVGSLGLLVSCYSVLRWNVALERVPLWRFRRNSSGPNEGTFVSRLWIKLWPGVAISHATRTDSDADEDEEPSAYGSRPLELPNGRSATPPPLNGFTNKRASIDRPKRKLSATSQSYRYMTIQEVEIRKWAYALFTYSVTLALILIVIRPIIGSGALDDIEPVGWALGYLFSDIKLIRDLIIDNDLQTWVPLRISDGLVPFEHHLRQTVSPSMLTETFGGPTIRLVLFAYWLLTLAIGISTVLFLTPHAEVDTRRKIFHAMMVLLLLPTTYIDPCFLYLGLILVLTVFLLLDLFRATQLRPLSKPLALFLAPYIDGRDLKGPVVVSHIFLLIGCAIPFWLGMAGIERTDDGPLKQWNAVSRDLSLVAGVVCVGMGDAAASLVGRRFGRTKWPWHGGKSIEGSAAFASAVIAGLLFGRWWLDFGGWQRTGGGSKDGMVLVFGKAAVAACGASFTEAVLTSANDNVVVPIVLWLLVRGLKL